MKRTLAISLRVLIIVLVVPAFFLVHLIASWPSSSTGPSLMNDVELLVTVVLGVSMSLWVTFADENAKIWKKAFSFLLFGLMALGSFAFFILGNYWGMDASLHPAVSNNVGIASQYMAIMAFILGFAAIAILIGTLRSKTESAS